MHILLDISRLISGTGRPAPTGIDRVEHAYARHFLARDPNRVTFLMTGPLRPPVALPHSLVARLLEALQARWQGAPQADTAWRGARRLARQARAWHWLGRGRGALRQALHGTEPVLHLLVSHRGADRPGPILALKRRGVRFIPFVHDLIPITHPEYAPPRSTRRHQRRLQTFSTLADGIIVNSTATGTTLAPYLAAGGRSPIPVLSAPLGLDPVPSDSGRHRPAGPYFLCLGTIEPRKNHLLLLHLWRNLAETQGDAAPKLILIGRRGWENENILDMLERCPALSGKVIEHAGLPDAVVAGLLQGARALLFPSFAEGYGLPLAEALALGVPAICSDLPALREVGGEVPDYLHPLDGPGWRRLILDYAAPDSGLRQAQMARLADWSAPSWDAHFALVDPWLERCAKVAPRAAAEASLAFSRAAPSSAALAPQSLPRG
ncbi:MAG: glycosyltransferase family 4 protein [Acetobacteraceae bacterium]